MPAEPIYRAERQNPAYHLRYSWTCWPSGDCFPELPQAETIAAAAPGWEADGLRPLEWKWTGKEIQIAFSTKPHVSPVFLAARAKGRLQHALRTAGSPQAFSRKLAVRSVGHNSTHNVKAYIARQVDKEAFADPAFEDASGPMARTG